VPSVSLRSVKAHKPEIPHRKDRQDLASIGPRFRSIPVSKEKLLRNAEKKFADPIQSALVPEKTHKRHFGSIEYMPI
jgi:hypothetical protein